MEREIDSPLVEKKSQGSGQWLWKNLKPFGCILCLACMVAMIVMCLTIGTDPIPGYAPPRTEEYYAGNPEALAAELEENVLPHVEGAVSCAVVEGKVEVRLLPERFAHARSAVLRYFDEELIVFVEEK